MINLSFVIYIMTSGKTILPNTEAHTIPNDTTQNRRVEVLVVCRIIGAPSFSPYRPSVMPRSSMPDSYDQIRGATVNLITETEC
jgi:hypothetical protein